MPEGKHRAMGSVSRQTLDCDECGSTYFTDASPMAKLCNECSHQLYGYPQCVHEFVEGRCFHCGWDGSVSEYLRERRRSAESGPDRQS